MKKLHPLSGSPADTGSVLVAAMIILAVTFVAVSATLFEASQRFRISNQSNRWAQAGQAAEGGAEIGLMTAQNSSWIADGWTGAPGAVGAAAVTKNVTLSAGVPNTGSITSSIAVDSISVSGSSWLRIRSTGMAELPGGTQSGIDTTDNLLRKVSLLRNRFTNTVLTAPQATRTYEALGRPNSPFTMGVFLNQKVTMSGSALVDSFDSGDSTKSTSSLYDVTKRQTNGSVGINDTQGATNFGGNYIYGNLSYSGATPTNMSNVTGTVTTPFNKAMKAVTAPTWTTYNASPSAITSATTLTGGTAAAPAYYKVSSLSLSGSNVLTLNPYAAGQQSYIEIWVTGNMATSGSSYVQVQNGVHVTFHVVGNVSISGGSISNANNVAANCLINVINPTSGSQSVSISGSGTMIAAINAPGADFSLSGGATISGAVIGKSLSTSGSAAIHYDEALARFGVSGYGYKFSGIAEAIR